MIYIILVGIILIPLGLLYLATNYDSHFRRIDPEKVKAKANAQNKESLKLLGFILILAGLGLPFLGKDYFGDLSIWPRIIIGLIGILMIYFSNKRKQVK